MHARVSVGSSALFGWSLSLSSCFRLCLGKLVKSEIWKLGGEAAEMVRALAAKP